MVPKKQFESLPYRFRTFYRTCLFRRLNSRGVKGFYIVEVSWKTKSGSTKTLRKASPSFLHRIPNLGHSIEGFQSGQMWQNFRVDHSFIQFLLQLGEQGGEELGSSEKFQDDKESKSASCNSLLVFAAPKLPED